MSKYARQLLSACFVFSFAFNVHATIETTLNGINYEWISLSETRGMTSYDIKLRLADPTDPFFGYEFASRALLEDLLLSYAPWDGLEGIHSNSAVTTGIQQFSSDFEAFAFSHPNPTPTVPIPTVDGGDVLFDAFSQFGGIYGSAGECGAATTMCKASFDRFFKSGIVAASQKSQSGWDSTDPNPFHESAIYGDPYVGSFLVREVPAKLVLVLIFWWPIIALLIGLTLIGYFGFKKRKKRT